MAVTASVTGMANQMASGLAHTGSRQMRTPLTTAPRPTETMKDVLVCRSAWN